MIDEIDKMGSDLSRRRSGQRHTARGARPEQNQNFRDHYLDLPFEPLEGHVHHDREHARTIPARCAIRMETIEIAGYTSDEKLQIAKRYLLPAAGDATA